LNTNKKIVFLTGTRADFGKLRPLIDKVEQSENFDCYIFVTGMHTLSKYGNTYDEVEKRNYKNTFVYMNQTHTTDQDTILANTITGFGNFVKEIKPDMVVIHGDRVETLAGAIVGSFNNILVSHIEGGEISGTLDELTRHAVTKLSQIHFVANNDAKKRLLQLGEYPESVFIIGSPDIEIMKSSDLPSIEEAKKRYEISFENYAIFIYHPIVTELSSLKKQISEVISALIESGKNYVTVYPNNDTGSDIILNEYSRISKNPSFKIFPSIRFEHFLSLLKNSEFIIGNSSAGVREAEVFGVPTINIGTRQKNRTKNINIINVNSSKFEVIKGIKEVANLEINSSSYFGEVENSSEKFMEVINNDKIWNVSIQKQFVDLNIDKVLIKRENHY